jgi:transposase, IS5 family
MRRAFVRQQRLDCRTIQNVQLNLDCRHELVPILQALRHVYLEAKVRDKILALVARDVNPDSRPDRGRAGFDYWQVAVLAAVRQGCGMNYDQLQDLAENHRALRHILRIGDWDEETSFNWRRIRDNVCHLRPDTVEKISHLIVAEGHRLAPEAIEQVRADSFVVETDIHWPTESTLIRDGLRKAIGLCVVLASRFGLEGWRQSEHLLQKGKKLSHHIERIASRKGPNYQERLKTPYRKLLRHSGKVLHKARGLLEAVEQQGIEDVAALCQINELRTFLNHTEQVRDTARRRVLRGEQVPNQEKLFSIFEPHTQLYKRGKAGQPMQFGRLLLVYEDAAGFIVHHHLLARDAQDADVAVEQTRQLQQRLNGGVKKVSFDRGFHSPENQRELAKIVPHVCLPKPGARQGPRQQAEADEEFHHSRQRHPGIESAVGALQRGNRLERCYDSTEPGLERYVALGVLGRNLLVLGKLLIAQEHSASLAAHSTRKPAA